MKLILSLIFFVNIMYADVVRVDDTVIDKENYLQWMNKSDTTNSQRVWKSAKAYCESSRFLDYNDWHLPSSNEMQTLVKIYNNKKVLKNLEKDVYWSKEVDPEMYGMNVFVVYLGNGHISSGDKCTEEHFICVRKYK